MEDENREERAKTAADIIGGLLNSCGNDAALKGFVMRFVDEHRTISQRFTSAIVLPFVREMARKWDEGLYDTRNEMSCRMCHEMWEALKRGDFQIKGDEDVRLPLF